MTVVGLVEMIHQAALEKGMDVSPTDVAFIISQFLNGLAGQDATPGSEWLRTIADEIDTVRDE